MTSPTRHRRPFDAVIAALALSVLLVGPPVALTALIGDPLPRHWPGGHAFGHALSAPVSDNTLLHVFAVITWLAWAHLLVCVVAELLRQWRGMDIRVPLGGPNERLARHLVTALLVALSASQATTGLTPALAASPTLAAMRAPAPFLASTTTASVQRSPTARDTRTLTAVGISAPTRNDHDTVTPVYKEYVVAPPHGRQHDNLWDIAARHLGDPLRWKEIFALNDGRAMPDGQHLTRASLIRPGWVLRMPPDSTGLPARPAETADGAHAVPDQRAQTAQHPAATAVAPAVPVPEAPGVDARGSGDPAPPPATRPASRETLPAGNEHSHREIPAVPVGAGLGVAAIGVLAALQRRRRATARRRTIGDRLTLPDPQLQQAELSLRRRATEARAVADAVRLAVALAARYDAVPTIQAVTHHSDGTVELHLDQQATAPAPFDAAADDRWLLRPDQHDYLFAVSERDDPIPVLLPVGSLGDGAAVYVNLEAAGVTGICGDDAAVDAVLTAAARALAGAPWAEQAQMVVPPRFASAARGLERIDVLGDPPALLEHVALYAKRVAATVPAGTTLAATRRDGTSEAVGVISLLGFTAEELPAELLDAAADATSPVVAVLAGETAAATWRLDGDVLHLPGLGPVTPMRPRVDEIETSNALLTQASATTAAAPDDPQLAALAADSRPIDTDPGPDTIQVNLLGPVELVAPGKPRRESVREMVRYLALHRQPRQDTVIYSRLFPDSEFSRDTIRSRMTEARRVLAGAIVHVDHSWGVSDLVTTDWQRFQALAAGSPDQQRDALRLVRGQPFQGYGGEWVHAEGHDRVIEAAIVDLAISVAERALDDGDDRFATEAVEAGLRASPYEERLYRLGMRASAARGASGEVRAYMRAAKRLLDVDVEPDDHLQPETEDLYRRLVSAERQVG